LLGSFGRYLFVEGKGLKIIFAVLVCTLILAGEVAWAKCWQQSDENSVSILCSAENGDTFGSTYSSQEGSFEEFFCLAEDVEGFDATLQGRQELEVWTAGRQLERYTVDVSSSPTSVLETSNTSPIAEAYSGYSCGTLVITGGTAGHLGWDGMVFSLGGEVSDRIYINNDVLLAYLSAVVGSLNQGGDSETDASTIPSGSSETHLRGGPNQSVHLGCYNCPDYDSDSICNEFGRHGGEYSSDSVWNAYSTFGNKYGLSSPWNPYSTSDEVPVLVGGDGAHYGYFTINVYRVDAFREAPRLKELYDLHDGDLTELRDALCG